MSISDRFSHFFKLEVQNSGRELIRKNLVYLQISSDTQIDASIRATTLVRARLRSDSVASTTMSVDCTCKTAQKGSMCKHIWAVLELGSEKSPDFFEMKTDLQHDKVIETANAASARPQSGAQASFKQKQADYRKQAYQVQKQRAKDRKSDQAAGARKESIKTSTFSKSLPDEVKVALTYFEVNGFPMSVPVDEATVNNAKRILSRVFHPDKGGAHEEMLELLRHSRTLLDFRL